VTTPIRSLLFAPANLGPLLKKLPRSNPDVAIACLEDGTPDDHKVEARGIATQALRELRAEGWAGRMFVRVNHPDTSWFEGDVACVVDGGFDGIVVPMVESAGDVARVAAALEATGGGELPWILGLETGRGLIRIGEIFDAATSAIGAYLGAEDYATSLGAVRSESNAEIAYARALVALHAKARGLGAFDCVTIRFDDDERFRRECAEARGFGFTGKLCIHPRQVPFANELFRPSEQELAWARRVLAEYAKAEAAGQSTPAIDGLMIDGPLVKRCQALLALGAA
jgi:citrate lyase subunit beta/citryl-CoA lyase